ncbi:MAG: DEAD/DEAH box helicase family protein [Clostridiales bacterium]|nr:DEAD/DEAH box helicase family protein [Clostridiales bacterium]
MSRQKAASLYSLEAEYGDFGYKLSWTNSVLLSYLERRLLSDYLQSKGLCLLRFGALNITRLSFDTSVKILHDFSSQMLSVIASYEDLDALKTAYSNDPEAILSKIVYFKSDEAVTKAIFELGYNEIIGISNNSTNFELKAWLDSLYDEVSATFSLSFGLEENTLHPKTPMNLVLMCRIKGATMTLSEALIRLGDNSSIEKITDNLKNCARYSALVARLYNEGNIKDILPLEPKDIFTFLSETELYSRFHIACNIPLRWRMRKGDLKISVSVGDKEGFLSADNPISFDMKLFLNGTEISVDELEEIQNMTDELFLFRDRWVELSKKDISQVLSAIKSFNKHFSNGIEFSQAFRSFISPDQLLNRDYDGFEVEIKSGVWLRNISHALSTPHMLESVELGKNFTGTLRPYQLSGLNWLAFMKKLGLGACLSDDMGLGKTVQVIALLENMRLNNEYPSLVVIPASLLQNWQNEFRKFAPKIQYRVLHNSFGESRLGSERVDVYITTYSMVSRIEGIYNNAWKCVILDEAQAIKNPATIQSRAVKRLKAEQKIVMTGTPVENSALDLWSIFDFLNPGLLGGSQRFMHNIQKNDSSERLKEVVRPFILRRLKTDKSVISDLPEKIEMKGFCSLSNKQAMLYNSVVNSLSDELLSLNGSGIERRGLVLKSILRLKQICNHPDQFTDGGAFLTEDSGKFQRLVELCESIRDMNERVLIFTQFREMCDPLNLLLSRVFGKTGLTLHGNTSVPQRGEIVRRFLEEEIPYIVLSLKAGGVGLNLTPANHVIHFDRWWNPAVENQATDRAFRIGQTKNVLVHKLICTGTLEEKIDTLIEEKRSLAEKLIDSDEGVKLTEMGNDELMELLRME